ncbi:serine/threonine-protein kinase [Actinomadura scrupuli]|uniref:serine/threonine-protein kinase n=1 Tax=Actinomadura scrupuli TaxID=559629 RepID=UPI003D958165
MSEGAGRVLAGRYRLLSHVGQGGMGTVWCARDELLDRDVAVKEVLIDRWLSDADRGVLHERTKREARATARLNHPGIVTVHDVIEEDGRPWIVMEFVRARSLQEIIDADGPLPPAQVAAIGRQLVGALRTAHAAGILHRDVKPANVLLLREDHEDRAVLTDFGIAQVEGDTTLTQTGLVMGSPAYIAPERAKGERATPATDLWALGATLYAACDGRPPHERTDAMATLAAVLTVDAPPPRAGGSLTPVLLGLLDRDPGRRLTAEAALDQLTGVVTETRTRPVPSVPTAAATWAEAPAGSRTQTRPDDRRDTSDPPPWQPHTVVSAHGGFREHPGHQPPGGLPPNAPSAPSAPGRPGRGINSGLLAAVGLLAVAVIVLVGFVAFHPQSGAKPSASPSVQSAGAQPGGSTTPRPTSPTSAAAHRPPPGLHTVTGPGYSLDVPTGWARSTSGNSVIWRDPATGAFVQVDRTGWTGDPYAHWEAWEPRAIADGALRSYQRVALNRVTGAGYDAADLEFTYLTKGGTAMHAVDRGVQAGGRSYAVFVSIPVAQWTSRSQNVDNFLDSFHP